MEKEKGSNVAVAEVETEKVETTKSVKANKPEVKSVGPQKEVSNLNLDKPIEVEKTAVDIKQVEDSKTSETGEVDTRSKFAKFLNLKKKKEKVELSEDIKKNKKWAWTAYILFFIPLLINKKSPFMRLHANEGLDVNIIDVCAVILMLIGKFIVASSFVWKTILLAMFFLGFGLILMTTITKVIMIISSLRGHDHQTPWLWNTRIIK